MSEKEITVQIAAALTRLRRDLEKQADNIENALADLQSALPVLADTCGVCARRLRSQADALVWKGQLLEFAQIAHRPTTPSIRPLVRSGTLHQQLRHIGLGHLQISDNIDTIREIFGSSLSEDMDRMLAEIRRDTSACAEALAAELPSGDIAGD